MEDMEDMEEDTEETEDRITIQDIWGTICLLIQISLGKNGDDEIRLINKMEIGNTEELTAVICFTAGDNHIHFFRVTFSIVREQMIAENLDNGTVVELAKFRKKERMW